MNRFPSQSPSRRHGFTIVELVVAFIIITILASVLVPTLISRSEQAKIAAARQDLVHLGDAQERVAIDTGFLVRINVLDDVGRPGDGIVATDPLDTVESILDNDITGDNPYINPTRIFISPASENYSGNNTNLFNRIVAESGYSWNGPYLQWPRDVNGNDWPDDPWGNDYLFFTRAGVIYPALTVDSTGTDGDGSFAFQTTFRGFSAMVFDRPTFLSLGPDGLPGDGSGGSQFGWGDDIYHQIGGVSGRTNTSVTQPRP